ncbi:hypothetical protein N824_02260 [Pedobacter sp. V48]|nr:hypothetical protein N824_02260 [Pedobacter sp. V48]
MSVEIIVTGSMNMDMVVKTHHIPQPGETVLGGTFFMNPGGKGANQAVAVARLGGQVAFIGKIGDDIFGRQSSQLFDEEGVDIQGLIADVDQPSGIAMITVDEKGENSIVVAPGANARLYSQDVETSFKLYPEAKILLVQLEIPFEAVQYASKLAREQSMTVILNPAPANESIPNLYSLVDIITPNLTEAEMLTGVKITGTETAQQAAKVLQSLGIATVIITLGSEGALLLDGDAFHHIPAPQVTTIDTTAAGDVFNGALAVALSEGKTLVEATTFACQAASIAVTRLGAQDSIPYRNEILLTLM